MLWTKEMRPIISTQHPELSKFFVSNVLKWTCSSLLQCTEMLFRIWRRIEEIRWIVAGGFSRGKNGKLVYSL